MRKARADGALYRIIETGQSSCRDRAELETARAATQSRDRLRDRAPRVYLALPNINSRHAIETHVPRGLAALSAVIFAADSHGAAAGADEGAPLRCACNRTFPPARAWTDLRSATTLRAQLRLPASTASAESAASRDQPTQRRPCARSCRARFRRLLVQNLTGHRNLASRSSALSRRCVHLSRGEFEAGRAQLCQCFFHSLQSCRRVVTGRVTGFLVVRSAFHCRQLSDHGRCASLHSR